MQTFTPLKQSLEAVEENAQKVVESQMPSSSEDNPDETTKSEIESNLAVSWLMEQLHQELEIYAQIRYFLRRFEYPVAAYTPFGDIVAFNEYYREAFALTDEHLEILRDGELGSNILRVYFDDRFGVKDLFGGSSEEWRKQAENTLSIFHEKSFRYRDKPRYDEVVRKMKDSPTAFENMWRPFENLTTEDPRRK